MRRTIKNTYLEELDNRINRFVYNSDLFAGGCCYAAYVIAKNLKKAGIRYRTLIWQYNEILNANNFNSAINGNGVAHVAIEVKYKNRKCVIGDCRGIYRYFGISGEAFKVRTYKNISPEMILEGYKNNEWNWKYDRHNNGPLMRIINNLTEKYI
jgi:hypothetical protein